MRRKSRSPAVVPVTSAEPRAHQGSALRDRYIAVRAATEALAAPLSAEDQVIQSMPDASPAKWHRAHTTWFFETFVLVPHAEGYRGFDASFGYLFNSYYEAVGPRHARPARGLLSRPSVADIARYRAHVDHAMTALIGGASDRALAAVAPLIELGLQHEQQHQELFLTDIKHAFWSNPIRPVYRDAPTLEAPDAPPPALPPVGWLEIPGGIHEIGHRDDGFCFDNELPVHRSLLRPYRIADRPVSVGEYLAFMADGGYERPEFWLSDGWATVQQEGWRAPFYWEKAPDGAWQVFTLAGTVAPLAAEPVSHVSYFEAAAFAAWAGKRLPSEPEYEVARRLHGDAPQPDRAVRCHPAPLRAARAFDQDVWEWTASAYSPYPGFRAPPGAIGEYNGKFMVSQMVLRGRSCVTPTGHDRPAYRNFFPPAARWQFSGVRLAEDA
jgi:ergothioneine biosynthesis protein EgtB